MAKPRSVKNKTSPMSLALTVFFIILLAGTVLFLFNEMKKQETLTTSDTTETTPTVSSSQTEEPTVEVAETTENLPPDSEKVDTPPTETEENVDTLSETATGEEPTTTVESSTDEATTASESETTSEPDTSEEPVKATETEDLQTALITCQAFLEHGPLSSGEKNALTCYQDLLKKYPNEAEVLQGLKQIEAHYVQLIKKAVDQGEVDLAKKALANLQKVNPKSSELKELQYAVQELQQKYADVSNQLYEGILTYEEGNAAGYRMYKGEIMNAKANGKGIMTFIDGKRLIGTWKNDTSVEVKPYIQNDPECFYFHKQGRLCCKKGDVEICE